MKKHISKSPYYKNIILTKETSKGMVSETGIVDYNVNPEYIPKNIWVDIEKNIMRNQIKERY